MGSILTTALCGGVATGAAVGWFETAVTTFKSPPASEDPTTAGSSCTSIIAWAFPLALTLACVCLIACVFACLYSQVKKVYDLFMCLRHIKHPVVMKTMLTDANGNPISFGPDGSVAVGGQLQQQQQQAGRGGAQGGKPVLEIDPEEFFAFLDSELAGLVVISDDKKEKRF